MACAAAPYGVPAPAFVPRSTRDDGFRVVSETVLHRRYLAVFDRTVEFPALPGATERLRFAYDVVGHPRSHFHFVTVFPFHARAGAAGEPSATMVREYAQGPNQLVWSFPAGGVVSAKHSSLEDAAAAELSEECALACSAPLVRLLPGDHPGLLESKWCMNRYTPFLAVEPLADAQPGPRDAEEALLSTHVVPLWRLEELLYGGDVVPHSVITAHLALRELKARGLLS